jgi:flagellar biosynthesis/type III secretory pathway chaperone
MSDLAREVTEIVAQELKVAKALIVTLEEEREALATLNTDRILHLANAKTESAIQAEHLARKRMMMLPPANDVNLSYEQAISTAPDKIKDISRKMWGQLRQTIKTVHQLNKRNGRIVTMTERSLEKGLRIVKGQNQETHLYNTKGSATAYTPSIGLVKA